MKKEDKERLIFEARLKEIESFDRDSTSMNSKFFFFLLALGAAGITHLYKIGFSISELEIIFIFAYLILLISLAWNSFQSYYQITDYYAWLVSAVKREKLLNESSPCNSLLAGIYYKPKYCNLSKKIGK